MDTIFVINGHGFGHTANAILTHDLFVPVIEKVPASHAIAGQPQALGLFRDAISDNKEAMLAVHESVIKDTQPARAILRHLPGPTRRIKMKA